MLAEQIDHVIGVDTHRDSHTAAVVDTTGAVEAETTVPADAFGYKRVFAFGRTHAPGRRAWAIEGTGSFGAWPHYVPARAGRVGGGDRPASSAGSAQRSEVRRARRGESSPRGSVPGAPGPAPPGVGIGRPSGCCSPLATVWWWPGPRRSAT
jgi:hypothetical protein